MDIVVVQTRILSPPATLIDTYLVSVDGWIPREESCLSTWDLRWVFHRESLIVLL